MASRGHAGFTFMNALCLCVCEQRIHADGLLCVVPARALGTVGVLAARGNAIDICQDTVGGQLWGRGGTKEVLMTL